MSFTLFLLTFNFEKSSLLIIAVDADADNPEDSIINCPLPFLSDCIGTSGKDIIIGTSASDRIFGEEGNDNIQGGLLTDEIHGDEGDDTIQGGEGSDVIFGGDGNDYLFADSPNSAIGLLLLNQQQQQPILNLEDSIGNEFQLQDSVIHTIEEEGLVDLISNETLSQFQINLANNLTQFIETLIDIQKQEQEQKNQQQQLSLQQQQNSATHIQLNGGPGDDHIFGGSGDDILEGGPDKDFFDCNEGMDTVLDFNPKEDTVNINCEEI